MTRYVILFRNTMNNRIGFVSGGDGDELAVFADEDDARDAARTVPICQAYPYQIIELTDIDP